MAIAMNPGMYAQYVANGNSMVPQPGSPNWNAALQQQTQASSSAAPEDPRFTQGMEQLRQQASMSDQALRDRVNQSIDAQRQVRMREAQQQVSRSLAANGLLPTGGSANRMYESIMAPVEERLNAASASAFLDAVNQRNSALSNYLSQVNDWQQAQRQWQFQQQQTAQQNMMNQWQAAMQRGAAADAAFQANRYSGLDMQGGGGGQSGPGPQNFNLDPANNSFLNSGTQPRDLYNRMTQKPDYTNLRNEQANAAANRTGGLNTNYPGFSNTPSSAGGSVGGSAWSTARMQPTGSASDGWSFMPGAAAGSAAGGGMASGAAGLLSGHPGATYSGDAYGSSGGGGGYGYGGSTGGYGRSMY